MTQQKPHVPIPALPQEPREWRVSVEGSSGLAGTVVYRGTEVMPGMFSNDTEFFHVGGKGYAERVAAALNAQLPASPAPQDPRAPDYSFGHEPNCNALDFDGDYKPCAYEERCTCKKRNASPSADASSRLSERWQELFWALPPGLMRSKLRVLEIDMGRALHQDGLLNKAGREQFDRADREQARAEAAERKLAQLTASPAPQEPRAPLSPAERVDAYTCECGSYMCSCYVELRAQLAQLTAAPSAIRLEKNHGKDDQVAPVRHSDGSTNQHPEREG